MNRAVNERESTRASLARQIRDTEQRLVRRRVAIAERVTAVGRALWTRVGLPAALLGAGAGGFLLARIVLPRTREGHRGESDEVAEQTRQTRRGSLFDRLLHVITLAQVVTSFVATARRNQQQATSSGLAGPSRAAGSAETARSSQNNCATEEIPNGDVPA